MALADKFGASYNEVKNKIKIKTITINYDDKTFDLKVRILLKREMEELIEEIANPPKERIEELYSKFSAPIQKSIDDGGEDYIKALNAEKPVLIILDNDMVLDGNSIRHVSTMTAAWELKVERYFGLLQSDIGIPVNETFAQISDELPESLIKVIMDEIEGAIKPSYKDVKKN